MGSPQSRADRYIRRTTTVSVFLVAVIAAVVSYRHMYTLACAHGEDTWTAAFLPLSVDGMIVTSSMSLLQASRHGSRGGWLSWTLLVVGSLASLAANVAVAEPTVIGRLIAAWPSFALIGAYEMLMAQVRRTAALTQFEQEQDAEDLHQEVEVADDEDAPSEADPNAGERRVLQRAAWQWALKNRLPDGSLPSGVAISRAFQRSPRWGRMIKNAGSAGQLG